MPEVPPTFQRYINFNKQIIPHFPNSSQAITAYKRTNIDIKQDYLEVKVLQLSPTNVRKISYPGLQLSTFVTFSKQNHIAG